MTDDPESSGSVKSIPTVYKDITFRSGLEADWATTLDSRNISWSYEPEGYILPSGAWYLPDFHLPDFNTWLEVKGPTVPGIEKAIEFSMNCSQWVIIGKPPLSNLTTWFLLDGHPSGGCWPDHFYNNLLPSLGWGHPELSPNRCVPFVRAPRRKS